MFEWYRKEDTGTTPDLEFVCPDRLRQEAPHGGTYHDGVLSLLRSPVVFRRLALASVAANSAIVVTGGAVRLTGSGLGCPTWPRCTETTLTPTAEYAAHGLIEFGNRLLTFALLAVVVATLLSAWKQRHDGAPRRDLRRLSVAVLLGIPAQAALGGVTVLTGLNPWTVAAHFLLSTVLIALAVAVLHRASRPAPSGLRWPLRAELTWLVRGLTVVTAAVIALGTVVTGSGPHSGDPAAGRTGLDPQEMSQLHADAVMLLIGLTVATWLALRVAGASAVIVRAAGVLLVVELAQGLVGFVQYFTGLPVLLVGLHLVGSCLVWIAAVRLWLLAREGSSPSSVPVPAVDEVLAVR